MESAGAMQVRMQGNMQYLRFPRRLPHPNYNVFLSLVYRARDTGSLVLEELNDQIQETLATVIPNML
jgi:hypothetical protein